jgi:acyl carrier protein
MNIEDIKRKLKDIIVNELDSNIGEGDIRNDISLFEDGIGLDSITIVNFIVQIEKAFQFGFAEDEINVKLFSSINSLAMFIATKVKAEIPLIS